MVVLYYVTLVRLALGQALTVRTFKAPEVLLRMPWDQKVDIWNVGVVVCKAFVSNPYLSVTQYDDRSKTSLTNNDNCYRPGTFSKRGTYFMSEIQISKIPTAITLLR